MNQEANTLQEPQREHLSHAEGVAVEERERELPISPEGLLEEVEVLVEQTEIVSDEIEAHAEVAIETGGSQDFIAQQEALLDVLVQENTDFLKQVSRILGSYRDQIAGAFRDNHIKKSAESTGEKFRYKNKAFQQYRAALGNPTSDQERVETARQNAQKAFEREYRRAEPLLQTLESKNWGNSKAKESVLRSVNATLSSIVDVATMLEHHEQARRILHLYEDNYELRNYKNTDFEKILSTITNPVKDTLQGERPSTERLLELYHNDPLLVAEYYDHRYNKDFDEIITDAVIEAYPDGGCMPQSVTRLFTQALEQYPEKYLVDPHLRQTIFSTLAADSRYGEGFIALEGLDHLFYRELGTLSPEATFDAINTHRLGYSGSHDEIFFALLPLEEEHFKKLYERLVYTYSLDSRPDFPLTPVSYTDGLLELFQRFRMDYWLQLPFVQYRKFGLDPQTRAEFLHTIVEKADRKHGLPFLVTLFTNFNEILEDIPEETVQEDIMALIEKSMYDDIEDIRSLYALLPECDVPAVYKEAVAKRFAAKYADRKDPRKALGIQKDNISPQEQWLSGQGEILPHVELEFYRTAQPNDLRHLFFEMLEGKRQVADRDLLIRKYAESVGTINAEEFIDIFLVRKQLDESYMDLFLSKVANPAQLWSQLNEKVRLEQIAQSDYMSFLMKGVEQKSYHFAQVSLQQFLEEETSTQDRQKAIELFFDALFKPEHIFDKEYGLASKNPEVVSRSMLTLIRNEKTTPQEGALIVRRYYKGLIEHEALHHFIVNEAVGSSLLEDVFEGEEKTAFLTTLYETKNPEAIKLLIVYYLERQSRRDSFFKDTTPEQGDALFRRGIALNTFSFYNAVLPFLYRLEADQKTLFFESLFQKNDIFENALPNEVDFFIFTVQRFLANDSGGQVEKLFEKIFASKELTTESINDFLKNKLDLISRYQPIFDSFIAAIERKNLGTEAAALLEQEGVPLSPQQVITLSNTVLKEGYLTGSLYDLYRNSTPGHVRFSMDKELFEGNIEAMMGGGDRGRLVFDATIALLEKQRAAQGEGEALVFTRDQERRLIRDMLVMQRITAEEVDRLYDLDPDLFKEIVQNLLDMKGIPGHDFGVLLEAQSEIKETFAAGFIDYTFTPGGLVSPASHFDALCTAYEQDPTLLTQVKEKVKRVENSTVRMELQSKLLAKDLYSPEELKVLYEGMREREDVRSAVLDCAELLGSLAATTQPEKMKLFFANGSEQVVQKIEQIGAFVTKYPFQNKGRTIAVMLFAKEYLPERSPEEIVEKVAEKLSKYERILDRYAYGGIPEGLRASIGVEYEITRSTADGYLKLTGRDLKTDIVRLSHAAHIGSGADAVHEVATRPATNPYLMLLELQLLNDIEYIDLNFERSPEYQKGSRGYHMTLGGESGLEVNANTNFLQNTLLAASWGGLHAGETGKRVSGGRGVTLRGRPANGYHNVKVFDHPTSSVELRSLSVDKLEPFQRSVLTSFHGAIAIQCLEKYIETPYSDILLKLYVENPAADEKEFVEILKNSGLMNINTERFFGTKEQHILYAWVQLLLDIDKAVKYHNNNFLEGETLGYLDTDDTWVDAGVFGGDYNQKRFEAVVESIDPRLSVEEYAHTTFIDLNSMFSSFSVDLADSFTKINNLYLKPPTKSEDLSAEKRSKGSGDQANAIAMLEITKLNNETVERRDDPTYLTGTLFDTVGERREGYYNIQGASERMVTHAAQRALLSFNKRMEEILN